MQYQLVIETPEGAFYVMPPTDRKTAVEVAALQLSNAYPEFKFTTPTVEEPAIPYRVQGGQTTISDGFTRKRKPIPPL